MTVQLSNYWYYPYVALTNCVNYWIAPDFLGTWCADGEWWGSFVGLVGGLFVIGVWGLGLVASF